MICPTCDRGIDKSEWHECPICRQEICDDCAYDHIMQAHDKTEEEVMELMGW